MWHVFLQLENLFELEGTCIMTRLAFHYTCGVSSSLSNYFPDREWKSKLSTSHDSTLLRLSVNLLVIHTHLKKYILYFYNIQRKVIQSPYHQCKISIFPCLTCSIWNINIVKQLGARWKGMTVYFKTMNSTFNPFQVWA